ncbi:biotin--[acetyl-CoA-carboxylase] ligase [Ilumatobacter sp.]|uniref:biotin--[acetyl-CoA-carboxylase] ligase n=1 Tax=Ilumatobacter sp. TaxID=1967498 RepID=UPI003B517148
MAGSDVIPRDGSGPDGEPDGRWSGPWPDGWSVDHVAETTSTNDDLLHAARRDEVPDRGVLAADHQTAGRGRLDRRWDAPAGRNLLVSILFREVPEVASVLTQTVGLALVHGLESLAGRPLGPRLGLKWPNDVVIGDRKLAGVLAQRCTTTGAVVVGTGVNVGWAPPGAASVLDDLDLDVAPAEVLHHLLVAHDALVADAVGRGAAVIARMTTIGRRVRVLLPAERELVGTARGVDDVGRLVVETDDGRSHVLDVGDVVHLRPLERRPG